MAKLTCNKTLRNNDIFTLPKFWFSRNIYQKRYAHLPYFEFLIMQQRFPRSQLNDNGQLDGQENVTLIKCLSSERTIKKIPHTEDTNSLDRCG